MTAPDIAVRRLHSSHLAGPPLPSPQDVVRRLGAVQSQDYTAASWSVAQRAGTATAADIHRLVAEGTILRTHVLRPTWHFVSPRDIRWMLKLSSPRVLASLAPYERALAIDDAVVRRSHAVVAAALQGGGRLTRAAIAEVLQRNGVDAAGQRAGCLLMHAELDGLVCSGGLRGRQQTYALLDEMALATPALDREAALAELAIRYFTSHGPAQLRDYAWWSGLTMRDARAGVELAGSRLARETVDGKEFFAAEPPPRPRRQRSSLVHLLANFDEYLVAYADRSWHVEAGLRERIPAAAVLAKSVVVDGRVIGGWRPTAGKAEVTVATRLMVTLDDIQRDALEQTVEGYGRFLGVPTRLVAG